MIRDTSKFKPRQTKTECNMRIEQQRDYYPSQYQICPLVAQEISKIVKCCTFALIICTRKYVNYNTLTKIITSRIL